MDGLKDWIWYGWQSFWIASRGGSRSHMPSSSQIQWACYKKWKVEWETHTRMCQRLTSAFTKTPVSVLPWTCWNEGKLPSRQTGGQCKSHKCWEAWDTTCIYKAKDITPLTAWRREAWKEEALDVLPWKGERGPSSIRWTLEPFQRQPLGNFWQGGLFWVHRYHLELNWTDIVSSFSVQLLRQDWHKKCILLKKQQQIQPTMKQFFSFFSLSL